MIIRREFIKRMAFVALASAFIDLPDLTRARGAVNVGRNAETFYGAFPHAPKEMTMYVKFVEREQTPHRLH